jgi:integrase
MTRYRELKLKIEQDFKSANSENDMRFYLLCLMALETGARVSDLLKLNFDSIQNDEIAYKNTKSKIEQEQIISNTLQGYIMRYNQTITLLGTWNSKIFYNPSKKAVLSRVTANRRSQKEYGINFHELRKESGKNTANQMGVVMASKFLGHSRVSTTDLYLKVSANEYKKQMRKLER